MTESQDKKYWRRWSAVCRANGWRWEKGFLVRPDLAPGGGDAPVAVPTSPHHAAVWQLATALALQEDRAPLANDLRHACHVHALGREISHLKITNTQFSRLLTLWGNDKDQRGLLIDPLCLTSDLAWSHPEFQTHASRRWTIEHHCVESYVVAVTREMFQTADWQSLPAAALGQLYALLHERPNAWRRAAAHLAGSPTELDPANAPF